MSKVLKVTPKGKAKYPWLNRPDTTFIEEGVYQCNLVLSKKAASKMMKEIRDLHKEAQIMYKKKNKSGKKAKLPFFENDDGDIEFKFSQRAKIKNKKTGEVFEKTIPLFNASNRPLYTPNVGTGSIIKISYEPYQYFHQTQGAGVTLRLKAVQVLDLVEWSQDYGFEEEEGYMPDKTDNEEMDEEQEEADAGEEEDDSDYEEEDSGEEGDEDIPF